jgi:hypothetical protein
MKDDSLLLLQCPCLSGNRFCPEVEKKDGDFFCKCKESEYLSCRLLNRLPKEEQLKCLDFFSNE